MNLLINSVYSHEGIIGCEINGTAYVYQKDVFGNVVALMSGVSPIAYYRYDAWGNCKVLNPNGTENTSATFAGNINPIRYRSYYYDADIGLYYLQTRYYDPETGRFINLDQIEYIAPDRLNGLNLYAYCNNNPVMGYDPEGTFALSLLLIGLFVGATIGFAGSVVSQGVTNGWDKIDWGQVGFDTLMGGLTGLVGGSGISTVGSVIVGGLLGFAGSVGSDLIANDGDFGKVNWGKAAVMGVIGGITGFIAKAGAGNIKAMNESINAGKSWGAKTFLNFGVSIADQSASQLARQTAALYFSNAILGYKIQAFTYTFIGLVASITVGSVLNKIW